jgi:beta-lactamase class D
MKYWLDKVHYGNADTTGGIDHFWLSQGLQITPEQQIFFFKRLKNNQLPFSQRSMDIVKKIMIVKDTLDYVIRAKTGWAMYPEKMVGWYVGYIEKEKKVYYFVNCIQSNDFKKHRFWYS